MTMNMTKLFNDPTMEKTIKIIQALWGGTIKLTRSTYNACLACQIGDSCFYFLDLKPEEVKEQYNVFSFAQMLLETIDEAEMDETEYADICDILGF